MRASLPTLGLSFLLAASAFAGPETAPKDAPKYDFTKDRVLYVVPYAHLDTQWRWTYVTSIDQFILNTIDQNLANFEKYPDNVFTFTGSSRFQMMKDYYPEKYEKVRALIRAGRWHVGGSSVDENDVNCPSTESILRQMLYGNRFFRREFGVESLDYMLPDCFGFQASLPSVIAHAGLKGFSTQKLTWGSPIGIPFTVGRWVGPDGRSIVAALDGTSYVGSVNKRLDTDPQWIKRMDNNVKKYGVGVDYRYFGVGDRGGAPRGKDIEMTLKSMNNPDGKLKVVMAGSDQMVRDLPDDIIAKLPAYSGDLLLTEHSCGSLTSQAYVKRWNRKGEELADAAERAAVTAGWLTGMSYPHEQLDEAWDRILCTQMHDIIPGTSQPPAYELTWNDQILSLNLADGVIRSSAAAIVSGMDTRGPGIPLVVYNALAFEREEVVEATVDFGAAPAPEFVRVAAAGTKKAIPAQVLSRDGSKARIAFVAPCASVGYTVLHVEAASEAAAGNTLQAGDRTLENAHYKVTLNDAGDVASIRDKDADREMLSAPARLELLYEQPAQYPAWNMDWNDRKKPVESYVDGPAEIRVVENGPVRVTLEVKRKSHDSLFTHRVSLSAGDTGCRVEFADSIDWQTRGHSLKASFPLTVSNPNATYNMGLGTIERSTDNPKRYEMPFHEWFDLTDTKGDYGAAVLCDSKVGSDKPSDNTIRLTLLYTPGLTPGENYSNDQATQDWGRHEIRYALHGHTGDWRKTVNRQARAQNSLPVVFQTAAHEGTGGPTLSFVTVGNPSVDIHALKTSEADPAVTIVRLQELAGAPQQAVVARFAGTILDAWETDGQERRIGPATFQGRELRADFGKYGLRTFAVKLAPGPLAGSAHTHGVPVALPFDTDVVSADADRSDGAMDGNGRTYPAELFPARIRYADKDFVMGSSAKGAKNAVSCDGRTLKIPAAPAGATMTLLFAATERVDTTFVVAGEKIPVTVPAWSGHIGQWDVRLWDRKFAAVDYTCSGNVTGFAPGYILRDPVAWFGKHTHAPKKNEAYRFCYLFSRDLPAGDLTLPDDPRVKLFAITVADTAVHPVAEAAATYDEIKPVPLPLRASVADGILVDGVTGTAVAMADRSDDFATLAMGAPSKTDRGEATAEHPVTVRVTPYSYLKHAVTAKDAPALNDGEPDRAEPLKDVGRFVMDLQAPVAIARVNTYSRADGDAAGQDYTLWGANGDKMPDTGFAYGKDSGWTLLAHADSTSKGPGGRHGTTIVAKDGKPMGPYRWLIWVPAVNRHDTAFTEFDVHEATPAR